jgi:hypothetical protein
VNEETKIRLNWLLKCTLILPVLAAVILFAGFFILLVWFGTKDFPPNDKVWDWLIAVVGTLLSFIVGLVGAAAHLRARRKTHLRHLLSVELKDLRNRGIVKCCGLASLVTRRPSPRSLLPAPHS